MAFVILHPQHVAKWAGRHHEFGDDLKKHAKARLPGFACPEWVEVVPELPVSSMFFRPNPLFLHSFRKRQRERYLRPNSGRLLRNSDMYVHTHIYML